MASGTQQFTTYHWGPGKHSQRSMTHGEDGGGNPWRDIGVVYWHPGLKELRDLSLNPYAQSVSQGTHRSDGETSEAVSELDQNGVRRKLVSRTVFDGPDKYRAQLREEIGSRLETLGEWEYVRSWTVTPAVPPAGDASKPSERLKPLEPFLGHSWETRADVEGDAVAGGAFRIQSTFEWIPYIDLIYVRSHALPKDGEPVHVLDAYLYYHAGAGKLRCLALTSRGAVYEGDATVLDGGGALQLDLQCFEGDRVIPYVVRFDFEKDGTVRDRVWSLEHAQRERILDVRHVKVEPTKV